MPILGWYQKEVLREKLPQIAACVAIAGVSSYGATALMNSLHAPERISIDQINSSRLPENMRYITAPGVSFSKKYSFTATLVEARVTAREKSKFWEKDIRMIDARFREGPKSGPSLEVSLYLLEISSRQFTDTMKTECDYEVTGTIADGKFIIDSIREQE